MKEKPANQETAGDYSQMAGKTTIAPDVLLTIARLTALSVPGVSRMGSLPSGAKTLFSRGAADGVHIEINQDFVSADLYLVLKNDVNIRDVSRQVQHMVARAVSEMVGMQVGRVNVHIEDIDYPSETTEELPQED